MKNEANRLLGTLMMHTRQTYFKIRYPTYKQLHFYFVSILSYAFFIHAYFKFSPHPNYARCLKSIKKVSFFP